MRGRRRIAGGLVLAIVSLGACGGESGSDADGCAPEDDLLISSRMDPETAGFQSGDAQLYRLNQDGSAGEILTTRELVATEPSLSPDGTRVVFVEHVGDLESAGPVASSLQIIDLTTREVTRITGGTDWSDDRRDHVGTAPDGVEEARGPYVQEPAWSPTSDSIVYVHREGVGVAWDLYTVVPGQEPTLLVDSPDGYRDHSLAWSLDGTRIAFLRSLIEGGLSGSDEVWVVGAGGGEARRVAQLDFDIDTRFGDLAWTPDGRRLLVGWGGEEDSSLSPVPLDPEIKVLPLRGYGFAWAGVERLYAFEPGVGRDVTLVRFEVADGRVGDVERLGELEEVLGWYGLDAIGCAPQH